MLGKIRMRIYHLKALLDDTTLLFHFIPDVTISHIFREHNQEADLLEKEALQLQRGTWAIQEWIDGSSAEYIHSPFISFFLFSFSSSIDQSLDYVIAF